MKSLEKHATEMTLAAPYVVLFALVLFIASLRFTSPSIGYLLTAFFVGMIELPLIWSHWRKPRGWIFGLIIGILIFSQSTAERLFVHRDCTGVNWWPLIQYLCIYTAVLLTLVFLLRRKILASIKETRP